MRNDVVGIIRSGTVILERADRMTLNDFACDGAVSVIRSHGNVCEKAVEIRFGHVAIRTQAHTDMSLSIDAQFLSLEINQIVFRNVVAEGVKELRRYYLRRCRHLRVAHGIELDDIDI